MDHSPSDRFDLSLPESAMNPLPDQPNHHLVLPSKEVYHNSVLPNQPAYSMHTTLPSANLPSLQNSSSSCNGQMYISENRKPNKERYFDSLPYQTFPHMVSSYEEVQPYSTFPNQPSCPTQTLPPLVYISKQKSSTNGHREVNNATIPGHNTENYVNSPQPLHPNLGHPRKVQHQSLFPNQLRCPTRIIPSHTNISQQNSSSNWHGQVCNSANTFRNVESYMGSPQQVRPRFVHPYKVPHHSVSPKELRCPAQVIPPHSNICQQNSNHSGQGQMWNTTNTVFNGESYTESPHELHPHMVHPHKFQHHSVPPNQPKCPTQSIHSHSDISKEDSASNGHNQVCSTGNTVHIAGSYIHPPHQLRPRLAQPYKVPQYSVSRNEPRCPTIPSHVNISQQNSSTGVHRQMCNATETVNNSQICTDLPPQSRPHSVYPPKDLVYPHNVQHHPIFPTQPREVAGTVISATRNYQQNPSINGHCQASNGSNRMPNVESYVDSASQQPCPQQMISQKAGDHPSVFLNHPDNQTQTVASSDIITQKNFAISDQGQTSSAKNHATSTQCDVDAMTQDSSQVMFSNKDLQSNPYNQDSSFSNATIEQNSTIIGYCEVSNAGNEILNAESYADPITHQTYLQQTASQKDGHHPSVLPNQPNYQTQTTASNTIAQEISMISDLSHTSNATGHTTSVQCDVNATTQDSSQVAFSSTDVQPNPYNQPSSSSNATIEQNSCTNGCDLMSRAWAECNVDSPSPQLSQLAELCDEVHPQSELFNKDNNPMQTTPSSDVIHDVNCVISDDDPISIVTNQVGDEIMKLCGPKSDCEVRQTDKWTVQSLTSDTDESDAWYKSIFSYFDSNLLSETFPQLASFLDSIQKDHQIPIRIPPFDSSTAVISTGSCIDESLLSSGTASMDQVYGHILHLLRNCIAKSSAGMHEDTCPFHCFINDCISTLIKESTSLPTSQPTHVTSPSPEIPSSMPSTPRSALCSNQLPEPTLSEDGPALTEPQEEIHESTMSCTPIQETGQPELPCSELPSSLPSPSNSMDVDEVTDNKSTDQKSVQHESPQSRSNYLLLLLCDVAANELAKSDGDLLQSTEEVSTAQMQCSSEL